MPVSAARQSVRPLISPMTFSPGNPCATRTAGTTLCRQPGLPQRVAKCPADKTRGAGDEQPHANRS
jgi:hypothetical protein